jgi:hypothetical protein
MIRRSSPERLFHNGPAFADSMSRRSWLSGMKLDLREWYAKVCRVEQIMRPYLEATGELLRHRKSMPRLELWNTGKP